MGPATRTCIVHEWCVDMELHYGNEHQRAAAREALDAIERIRRTCTDLVEFPHGHVSNLCEHFRGGDTAILCGAYRDGGCLTAAHRHLQRAGVHVLYHKVATLPFDVDTETPDRYQSTSDELMKEVLAP